MASKDTMILKDGTAIELETGTLGALQVLAVDKAVMVATWDKLTPDNLSVVRIESGDGLVIGNYTDLVLVSATSVIQPDGVILTTYSIREKTEYEHLAERLSAVEETTDVLTMESLMGGEEQ